MLHIEANELIFNKMRNIMHGKLKFCEETPFKANTQTKTKQKTLSVPSVTYQFLRIKVKMLISIFCCCC